MKELEFYSLDEDQPTTCPKCGARTKLEAEFAFGKACVQKHTCLYCKFEFLGTIE